MSDATIAEQLPCLPDPGERFMIAIRKGNVELACVFKEEDVEQRLQAIAIGLYEAVQRKLTEPA